MPNSTFRRSVCCLIRPDRLVDMEPRNSILSRDMNTHIKPTSRMVETPPITISTTYHKYSVFNIVSSASGSESSIAKPTLSVRRTALRTAKSSLLVLTWLPPLAPCPMWSPNSWDPKTAVMESILTLWSKASQHYSTILKTQCTARQYSVAHGSLYSIRVVTRRIYRMNNCMQWSSVFTMVLRFKLTV